LPKGTDDAAAQALLRSCYALPGALRAAMDDFAFHRAIGEIVSVANEANEYFDAAAPWALRKTDKDAAGAVLYTAAECVRCIAIALLPFAPVGAGKLLDALGIAQDKRTLAALSSENALSPATEIAAPDAAFPRLTVE